MLKCLPTLTCALVLKFKQPSSPRQRSVRSGLLFSAIGDAALVWPQGFLIGMLSFAIGHFYYISSIKSSSKSFLGESPKYSLILGFLLYGSALLIFNNFLQPGISDPVLLIGIPIHLHYVAYNNGMSCHRNVLSKIRNV